MPEVDYGLGDRAEVPDLRLLERRHHLTESVVELSLLLARKLVRIAELQDDFAIWQVNESQSAFDGRTQ